MRLIFCLIYFTLKFCKSIKIKKIQPSKIMAPDMEFNQVQIILKPKERELSQLEETPGQFRGIFPVGLEEMR